MKRRRSAKRRLTVQQQGEAFLSVTLHDSDGQRLVALFRDGELFSTFRDVRGGGTPPLRAVDSWFESFANDVREAAERWW